MRLKSKILCSKIGKKIESKFDFKEFIISLTLSSSKFLVPSSKSTLANTLSGMSSLNCIDVDMLVSGIFNGIKCEGKM